MRPPIRIITQTWRLRVNGPSCNIKLLSAVRRSLKMSVRQKCPGICCVLRVFMLKELMIWAALSVHTDDTPADGKTKRAITTDTNRHIKYWDDTSKRILTHCHSKYQYITSAWKDSSPFLRVAGPDLEIHHAFHKVCRNKSSQGYWSAR